MNIFKKILFFFNAAEKRKLLAISICVIAMGCMEMVGIATVLPFLAVVTKPEIIQNNLYLSQIYHFFAFSSTKMFMLFLGAIVFAVLVLGNAFSAFTSWLIVRFCYKHGEKISCELLKKYLSQPYVYFLNRHSSDLSKNILSEVDRLITGIFINGIQSFAKFVMMLCIFVLLLIVEPLLALMVIFILGGAYVLIYGGVRKGLLHAGRKSSEATIERYQLIHEVLGAIKELKILGREQQFHRVFKDSTNKYAKAESLCYLSPLLTRYTIEAIAFGGMVLIALYLIGTQEDISKFMPLLGLYALAGYRLMPAMQQLFTGFSSARYHLNALETLYQEMELKEILHSDRNQEILQFKKSFQLIDIHYHYPYMEREALKNIHLNFQQHSTIGIVGASGAGKTTLIDIILGLLIPQQGRILVDNVEIDENNLKAWQQNIGYVPQNIFLLDTTIASNIALGIAPEKIDLNALEKAAKLANLHEFVIQELPEGYQTLVGERGVRLSGGQRQRIGIARALYHDPELLIFDEATSALDGITEKVIMEAIKSLSQRKTIILIAHRLNTVKDCDEIYVLNKGEIVGRGTYAELFVSNRTFQHLANEYANN